MRKYPLHASTLFFLRYRTSNMKRKNHRSITRRPLSSATGMLLALLTAAPPAFAQTTYYRDGNGGATAGFGTITGLFDNTFWNPNANGIGTLVAWTNDDTTPNLAVFDYAGHTNLGSTIEVTTDLNLGGLEIRNLASSSLTSSAGLSLSGAQARTITFGTGAVVSVSNKDTLNSDLSIRAINTAAGASSLTLAGGFTKQGAGTLLFTAQTSGSISANESANVTVTGTVKVEEGMVGFVTFGVNTRTITATGATFDLAAGTSLRITSPLDGSATGNADFGVLAGTGTVLGEGSGTNTITVRAAGITPGTEGTIGTLTFADFSGTNSFNNNATAGSTAFSFANIAEGGLKFDLGAPGTSDSIAFSSLSTVNLAGLAFSHFDFNQLAGFGAGTYTLVSGLPSIVEGSLGETSGTIDGRPVTLAINGSSLELTVGGAGSDTGSSNNSQTAAFARIFRHHAVLQRGKQLPVWGFAPPGQKLTVRFGNQSVETVADPDGAWQTALEPLEASFEPERLILTDASGETLQVVEDLLVGEVWVLGGQSNMAWWLNSSEGGEAAAEQADYPWLRVFDPGWQLPDEPASDAAPGAKWTVCSPATAGRISAIGFWFAEALHRNFEVPVGLVQTAVSGTYGECWVPREVLEAIPEARPRLDEYQAALDVLPQETERWEEEKAIHEAAVAAALEVGEDPPQPSFFVRHGPMGPNHFQRPYALFNGRIAPVAPFSARGVVWYQGEGNTQKPRAPYYDDILRGLLASWRKAWKAPELPFIIVQLPRFVPGIHNDWPMVREKQFEVAREDPHAGLVSTIDLGDPTDIHPRDKEPFAERVTRLALSLAYGQSVVATGPLLQSVSKRGETFELTFSQTGEGLRLSEGDTVRGFVFETETGETLRAEASLSGPNTVTLSAPGSGAAPIRIRYAAENLPDINLINSAGLPAAPFRYELSIALLIIRTDSQAGNIILTLALKAGQRYQVQSSQDLATWETWTLNVPVGEFDHELQVIDDGTYTNPHPNMTKQRFYRLIEQGPRP